MPYSPTSSIRRKAMAEIDVPPGEVRVIESHHAPEFAMTMAAWPFHKICWVAIGSGTLESTNALTSLRKDDFLLLPAGWSHRFADTPSDPLTLVIVCISAEHISQNTNRELARLWNSALKIAPPGAALSARTGFHHTTLVERIRRALQEQISQQLGWQTAMRAATDALVLQFARGHLEARASQTSSSRRAVAGAIEYLDAHPFEPLQIASMADRCGLSPRRFTDLWRQLTGDSFNNYLNRQRINFAVQRLHETGHILYACHEAGFHDLAYFYRVFKKQTGQTPGEFLRQRSPVAAH